MKKQLIITSLFVISACASTNNISGNVIPTEIDGLKVFKLSQIKSCGLKNKQGSYLQVCDKKTDELLTGVKYETDSSDENISYYKDGWMTKFISKDNGVIVHEYNTTIDIENKLFNHTYKNYFDDGSLSCERTEIENIEGELFSLNETCYYNNGGLMSKTVMNRDDGYVKIDYDPSGKVITKRTKPSESPHNEFIDPWTRYDINGNLYTGKITYYFQSEPERISSIIQVKNGKLDGESQHFPLKEDFDAGDRETIYTYENGAMIKSKTFKENKEVANETILSDNNSMMMIVYHRNNRGTIRCTYKDNSYVMISGKAVEEFLKLFKKDSTKSICPDLSRFIK